MRFRSRYDATRELLGLMLLTLSALGLCWTEWIVYCYEFCCREMCRCFHAPDCTVVDVENYLLFWWSNGAGVGWCWWCFMWWWWWWCFWPVLVVLVSSNSFCLGEFRDYKSHREITIIIFVVAELSNAIEKKLNKSSREWFPLSICSSFVNVWSSGCWWRLQVG